MKETIIGGDISDIECSVCEELMIYVEFRHPTIEDESELGLICEQCESVKGEKQ
jgi:hypothetical protein